MKKLISTAAALVFGLSTQSVAFDASDNVSNFLNGTFGNCNIFSFVDAAPGNAFVATINNTLFFAGGSRFEGNTLIPNQLPITDTALSAECFDDPSQANNFNVIGVDPAEGTFASDTRIGFAIEVTSDMTGVGGFAPGTYNFYTNDFYTYSAPANVAPIANAGPDQPSVASGAVVTLYGRDSSDSDGTIASYAWTRTGGTGAAVSFPTNSSSPSFLAESLSIGATPVTYVFSLVVTDNLGLASTADTVTITVQPPVDTQLPVANAGADQTVASEAAVSLNGSGSTDNDAIASYAWTTTSGVTLTGANTATPSFTAPTIPFGSHAGAFEFTLTVTDNAGNTHTDTVTITVQAAADTTPPDAPTAANTTITTHGDGTVTVSGTTEPNATVTVIFPDGTTVTGLATASGAFSVTSAASQPTGSVAVSVSDPAGNTSATLSASFIAAIVEQTQTEIASFLQSRTSHLTSSQPDLVGLLSGNVSGAFNAAATRDQGSFDFATSQDQAIWASVQGSWSESDGNENSYFFGAAGAHTNVSPNALVGMMVQFDSLTQEAGATTTEGDGYLVGPYVVARLPDQPLYFEGRYLFGRTENSTTIGTAAAQNFDTDRRLASLKVAGQLSYGDLRLTPNLTATHLDEVQQAFIDNDGNAIAEQGITQTDVALGLDFAKPLNVERGALSLTGGFASVWSQTEGSGTASTIAPDHQGQHGQAHLGLTYLSENGITYSAGTNYVGLGASDFESWSLHLGISMPF